MKLQINLIQTRYSKQSNIYLSYLFLSVILIGTLSGSYYWYSSLVTDIARYNDRLKRIEEDILEIIDKPKDVPLESISKEERELLTKEAVYINNIIKSRTMSWSGLLTQLEKVTISDISLVSLTPKVMNDKVWIDIRGIGKDIITITMFMDRLEKSPLFQDVFLSHSTESELNGEKLVNFSMGLEYMGQ